MHKKVENLLEEKLFFERRRRTQGKEKSWTTLKGKEYCSIDDSVPKIQRNKKRKYDYLRYQRMPQIKPFAGGVSYSSTSHVSKGLSNLT